MTSEQQTNNAATGILVVNLGTPDSPEVADVRRYLKEFLWDPRVVDTPRWLWWIVLNGIILNTRPKRSAEAYAKVWTEEGSPLLSISRKQADALRECFSEEGLPVELGMRYGKPSIEQALVQLDHGGCEKIVALPMYPQFSHTTTSSVQDELDRVQDLLDLKQDIDMIRDFHSHPAYINALAGSVKRHWETAGPEDKLLMSFHGIPQDYADAGDPYPAQCHTTAELLAKALDLAPDRWQISFQSRLGPKQWLTPYTDKTLAEWGGAGVGSVSVICPGFSADCLETLEEVAMENREIFLSSGGEHYAYIPCLNDSPDHIDMLANLIRERMN